MKKSFLFAALLALVFSGAVLQCQQLTVQNDSGKQVLLRRADLEALPQVRVVAAEHSSGPVNFEGMMLTSVLERAGVIFGESMKGKRLTNCLRGSRRLSGCHRASRVGPWVHRQAGFAGVLSGWEIPQ